MGNFFGLDSPFNKFGNMVADVLILSFFWLIFSIPIFTIGASTTALYYVATRRISNKENYLFKDFFKSFKREFLKSTIVWVFLVITIAILLFNITQINFIKELLNLNNVMFYIFLSLQYFVLVEILIFTVFAFPLLARFEVNIKPLVKNAFFLANRHFLTSLLCLIIAICIVVITFLAPPFFIAAMGAYAFLTSYLLMRIFKKYRPEIDKDDSEDESELL